MRVIDVARETGFSAEKIRRAERQGILPPAPRDLNGHRRYTLKDLQVILRILFPARAVGNGAGT